MHYVCTIVSGELPYQVGPYESREPGSDRKPLIPYKPRATSCYLLLDATSCYLLLDTV